MIKKLSFLIGLFLFGILFSQKKEQLQKQNAELKKQIASINANFTPTPKRKKDSSKMIFTSGNWKLTDKTGNWLS